MAWALLLAAYLSVHLAAAQLHRRALYPSAHRVKRGTYALIDPWFQSSVEDVNLLFEMLLAGMQVRGPGGAMLIPDEELASLHGVDKLEVICEDVLPQTLPEVRRLAAELARRGPRRRPLSRRDFERTALTLVYAAQTAARLGQGRQREAWSDAALQLFRALQEDLAPS